MSPRLVMVKIFKKRSKVMYSEFVRMYLNFGGSKFE